LASTITTGTAFLEHFRRQRQHAQLALSYLKGKAFEEVAMDVGVAYTENGKAVSGMGAEFRDLDNDGFPDIWHTATELETFPLFRNRGDGIFLDRTGVSGLARPTLEMSAGRTASPTSTTTFKGSCRLRDYGTEERFPIR